MNISNRLKKLEDKSTSASPYCLCEGRLLVADVVQSESESLAEHRMNVEAVAAQVCGSCGKVRHRWLIDVRDEDDAEPLLPDMLEAQTLYEC
jgi:hypothetical protein